ncbi:cytochrome P450 1A1 [Scyliorhinus canicula]|uniref:cytochrome P450 1A1 n=1 Tax=Scyliorhinus canicula TaxID=7830 RepID=UPI0018F75DCB|nr:cytochrome P450 1A1 [Scyliorhinus canicula]
MIRSVGAGLMASLMAGSVTEVFVGLAVFSLIFLLVRARRGRVPEGLKRPPCPPTLPFIGHSLRLGANPHLTLTALGERYGDIFQIQIGTRPVLVLSGLETLRQALIRQGDDFAGRPNLYSFRYINEGKSLTFSSDYSQVWRLRRKLAQNALRAFSADECKNSTHSCLLEEHVCGEAQQLVGIFLQQMGSHGAFDPVRYLVVSVANVICALCFGKHYSHDDEELLNIVNVSDEFVKTAASGNPADFIPILRFLPNYSMAKFIDLNRRFVNFVGKIVTEHYRTFDKDNIRDITDSLINHCQDKKVDENANIQISDEKIVGIVNDLFGAGFDTITTALSWSVMYLVQHPDMQKRLHEEIDENIGKDRSPRILDRSLLPYTEAFILETFRHSSFLPFTIPHCTTKDTALNGYFIPKNTCVFVNQWQVNHDPTLWKDPFVFCPDRFLNPDGKSINKVQSEKVQLFGMGKRRCIGEPIARMEVFLFFTTLVQQLRFENKPGQDIDMTPQYGLTMKHKRCDVQVVKRFPANVSE